MIFYKDEALCNKQEEETIYIHICVFPSHRFLV